MHDFTKNVIVFGLMQHFDVKIQFYTKEGTVVILVEILEDQNL